LFVAPFLFSSAAQPQVMQLVILFAARGEVSSSHSGCNPCSLMPLQTYPVSI
jgi:hypothetical protein